MNEISMAKTESDIKALKNTKITVFVDEALPDILVVTYEICDKTFKGVLLDTTKRNLPCGVPNINPAFTKNPNDDPLYAVNQRFAYTDPTTQKKKNIQISSKYKHSKMTVRLRPRQVLCSKCKGICNENSENVSRKRKASDNDVSNDPAPTINTRRSTNAPVTRSLNTYLASTTTKKKLKTHEVNTSLIPKLEQKDPLEDPLRIDSDDYMEDSKKPNLNLLESSALKKHSRVHSDSGSSSDNNWDINPPKTVVNKRKSGYTLRKKRSIESFDESSSELHTNDMVLGQPETSIVNINSIMGNARTIKISYGPQGEGTVLKIPASQINSLDEESEGHENTEKIRVPVVNRAAKKALKRAKREARKKVLLSNSYLGGTSPRYPIGGVSPRQSLGGASPRYTFDINMPRRRKHKMKHKKKQRDVKDRKLKESEVSSSTVDEPNKSQCITQKLSINLRRLKNSYTPCPPVHEESTSSSSDDHNEQVPDFPPPNPPLVLRINAQTVSSAQGAEGVRLLVGDVVWGKIHGFPWWPAKILTITNSGIHGSQAHVSWYGSSTSSVMQCDQLSHYLDNFKVRYNKKKKGPYKEAIKQATQEARENAENLVTQPINNSPNHNIIQVVPPALASPREIDVVS